MYRSSDRVGWRTVRSRWSKIASFQHPPIPRSRRSGTMCLTANRQCAQDFCRPIVRMVIDNDYVELEVSALDEGTLNGFENCPLAIPNRDDDAGLNWKKFSATGTSPNCGLQACTDSFEMGRRDALHFDLVVAIARIHIVELLLTRRPRINRRRVVQRFGNPHDGVFFRNPQAQVV